MSDKPHPDEPQSQQSPSHVSGSRGQSYVLGERIAGGGMAEVFRATAPNSRYQTPIVIKRMLEHLASDRSFVTMFVDEARISSRLDHPNIVKVYDFEATERGLSLVMEFVDGPDLLAILSRVSKSGGGMPAEHAVYIACHVLEALDYAHHAQGGNRALNIVHRDISPSNILVTRKGKVKLADFGIARANERQHEAASGTLKGKFGYMSPEQISGDELDGRSDLFSVGIVLAEMLMGKRLFAAPTDLSLLLQVRNGELSRLERYGQDIPSSLKALLYKSLAVNCQDRFQSAAEMRDELAAWLSQSPKRTNGNALAAYLSSLEGEPGDLCRWKSTPASQKTLAGQETQLARINVEKKAALGRDVFALGASVNKAAGPSAVQIADEILVTDESSIVANLADLKDPSKWKLESGSLELTHPLVLLSFIRKERCTGQLTVKKGDSIKEMYFSDGNPEFVSSNVHSDRFGQFLVANGVISEGQLSRVLAALPHFEGKMAEALVSLSLLKPVEAVRLLGEQILHKILHFCTWEDGKYRFREGVRNDWPARSLQLQTSEVVNRGLGAIPKRTLQAWVEKNAHLRFLADQQIVADHGFSPKIADTMYAYQGRQTLAEILRSLPSSMDKSSFVAASYLLGMCRSLEVQEDKNSSVQTSALRPAPTRHKTAGGNAGEPGIAVAPTKLVERPEAFNRQHAKTKLAPYHDSTVGKSTVPAAAQPKAVLQEKALLELKGLSSSEHVEVEINYVAREEIRLRVLSEEIETQKLRKGQCGRLYVIAKGKQVRLEVRIASFRCVGENTELVLALQTGLMPMADRVAYAEWSIPRARKSRRS